MTSIAQVFRVIRKSNLRVNHQNNLRSREDILSKQRHHKRLSSIKIIAFFAVIIVSVIVPIEAR